LLRGALTVTVGGATTVSDSVSLLPLPPFDEVTAPVLFW
jgi:hypothetical protein